MTAENTQKMTALLSQEDNKTLADIVKRIVGNVHPPTLPTIRITLSLGYAGFDDSKYRLPSKYFLTNSNIIGLEIT